MKIEKKKKKRGNTNENADKLNATLCTARDEKRQTRQIPLNDEADAVAMQRGVVVVKKKKREKSRIMPVKKKSKV